MGGQLYVDQDECTSCGDCVEQLPEVFRFDSYDLAEVHNPNGADQDAIREVINRCPVQCIKLLDEK